MKKFFLFLILGLLASTLYSKQRIIHPIYTGYTEEYALNTFRSFVLYPDTIFYILWKDNNYYPPNIARNKDYTDELLSKWRENIEIFHIQSALIWNNDSSGYLITRICDSDPIFADSAIVYSHKRNPDSIQVIINLPNNDLDLSVTLTYSKKGNVYLKKSMQNLDSSIYECIVSKDEKTITFKIPGDSKLLGYCLKPLKIYSQNEWGQYLGRVSAPRDPSEAINLFDSDIQITLPAVNKFIFTEPLITKSPLFIEKNYLYWIDNEIYLHDLDVNFLLLQPFINDYISKLQKMSIKTENGSTTFYFHFSSMSMPNNILYRILNKS